MMSSQIMCRLIVVPIVSGSAARVLVVSPDASLGSPQPTLSPIAMDGEGKFLATRSEAPLPRTGIGRVGARRRDDTSECGLQTEPARQRGRGRAVIRSDPVIFAIPGDEAGNALVDSGDRGT